MDQHERRCAHQHQHHHGHLEHLHPGASNRVTYDGPDEHRLLLSCEVIDVGFFGEPQGSSTWNQLTGRTVEERIENGAWVYVLNDEFDLLVDEYEEEEIPADQAEAVADRLEGLVKARDFEAALLSDLLQLAAFIRAGGKQGFGTLVVL